MYNTGGFGSSMLPSRDTPLKSQIYDEETGETWSDFFEKAALEQMKEDNKIYVAAMKANYRLPEEDRAKMEAEIENLRAMGYTSGFSNFNDYLRSAYGKSMTEEAYRKNAERSYLINSYIDHVKESFSYSPEDIESYYNENKHLLDTFTYRYFLVSADVNRDDYPDESSYESAKAEAVKAAGAKAEEYAARITDEQSFIDVAREYDPEANKDDDATKRVYKGELLGAIYGEWLRDEARKTGDVSTFEMANGYYVVMFLARDDNHYPTVNVQAVLVKQAAVNENTLPADDDDTAYEEAAAANKKIAEDAVNTIFKEWLDGGATQEKLAELMETHRLEISAEESKLYENVYKNQLPDIDNWIYHPDRKPGDHTVLYVDSVGYYILNFVGFGKQYSDILSDTKKRDKDLRDWKTSLPGGELKTTWLMALTK
jgi:hypothetical protein